LQSLARKYRRYMARLMFVRQLPAGVVALCTAMIDMKKNTWASERNISDPK
jgi:hypothetical protein